MHYSVLLKESIDALNIKSDGVYVDCTLGYAGHSKEILKKLDTGKLYAFDNDEEAIRHSEKILNSISKNYEIFHDNFKNIDKHILESVDGIIYDLGVSSPQLDEDDRGFSFHKDAKLDMRMDKRNKLSAYEVVNAYPLEKLIDIFYMYGEEVNAKYIAKAIVKQREIKPIETTLELAELIKENVPISYRKKSHPARKVFQAIRIEVNDELNSLETSLESASKLLNKGGRICVITFHSLEDRIVKNIFNRLSSDDKIAANLPVVPEEYKSKFKIINKKVILPSDKELEENYRSRSAKLRIIEKL